MKPYYEQSGITIYHGDCREILPAFAGVFDAILTDPPYGIGASTGIGKYGKLRQRDKHPEWDKSAVNLSHLPEIQTIVWGGNYFALRPSRMFLVWNKGAGFAGRDFAECEQAWCSWDGNAKVLTRDPLANRDYKGKEHPTEKPLAVMKWCIGVFPARPTVICDPYLGSGSSIVAAKALGLGGIGIEIEERYCEVAARRLNQESFPFTELQGTAMRDADEAAERFLEENA